MRSSIQQRETEVHPFVINLRRKCPGEAQDAKQYELEFAGQLVPQSGKSFQAPAVFEMLN